MPSTTRFNCLAGALAKKIHDLSADNLYLMLTNVAPLLTNTVKADITEISAGGGYSAGGFALTRGSFVDSTTDAIWRLFMNDLTFTPSGTVATWQYAVVYNNIPTNKNLLLFADYGVPIALTGASPPFKFEFDQVNGFLRGN